MRRNRQIIQLHAAAPLVVTRLEAAQVLKISPRLLDGLVERGEIAAARIGTRVLIPHAELIRFIGRKVTVGRTAKETISA